MINTFVLLLYDSQSMNYKLNSQSMNYKLRTMPKEVVVNMDSLSPLCHIVLVVLRLAAVRHDSESA